MIRMKKVGEILRKARQDKLLTISDVSEQTKIHPDYLHALEEGEYQRFSSEVHLKGFLKSYASFLGLTVSDVLAFFRREYQETAGVPQFDQVKPLNAPKFIITPSVLLTGVVVTLVSLFFAYLFFQYRSFAGAPLLIVEQPLQDELTLVQPNLAIVGRTDPDATIKINGQKISLGDGGVFSTSITLSDGLNVLNIVSTNKLGKESKSTKRVVVDRQEDDVQVPEVLPPEIEGLVMEVSVGPNASWVEVEVDGQREFDGLLAPGVVQGFKASSTIKILSGNGGSTQITLNGEQLGPLGEEGSVVEREFTRDGEVFEDQGEATPSILIEE